MQARAIQFAKRFRPAAIRSFFAIAAVFATVNFAVVPLMSQCSPQDWMAIWVYICMGLIVAQGGLIVIWCVLGSGNPLYRLVASFGASLHLYLYWAAGVAFSEIWKGQTRGSISEYVWKPVLLVLLCLPGAFLAAQFPLWLVKLGLAWRIERTDVPFIHVRRPLGIRDMMLATGLVGVALAGARAGAGVFNTDERMYWIPLGITAASLAGVSLISTLPAVVATLRASRPAIGTAVIFLYAVVAAVISISIISYFTRQRLRTWEVFTFVLVLTSFAAGLTIPLLIARRLSYRLLWGEPISTHGDVATTLRT
jgi:hypothetical protein